ncbi:MAG: hypothetical protein IT455_05585 [Planctomycetes bacterium]|nr:hypothetical protein [Planctomycetota bacterium]
MHPTQERPRSRATIVAALLLASCHSLAGVRVDQRLCADDRTAVLGLWCRAPHSVLADGEAPVAEAAAALVLYPLDVLLSTMVAVRAPFDAKLEVRGGPFGAVAGICLPWVTLVPYIHPPFHVMFAPQQLDLTPPEFDRLLARIRAGDGVAAYRELGRGGLGDVVYAVEMLPAPAASDGGGVGGRETR